MEIMFGNIDVYQVFHIFWPAGGWRVDLPFCTWSRQLAWSVLHGPWVMLSTGAGSCQPKCRVLPMPAASRCGQGTSLIGCCRRNPSRRFACDLSWGGGRTLLLTWECLNGQWPGKIKQRWKKSLTLYPTPREGVTSGRRTLRWLNLSRTGRTRLMLGPSDLDTTVLRSKFPILQRETAHTSQSQHTRPCSVKMQVIHWYYLAR